MTQSRGSVYVSSPLGFTHFGRIALRVLYDELEAAHLEVRDPWRWPDQKDPSREIQTADLLGAAVFAGQGRDLDVSHEIAARNIMELTAANCVLAILDGVDVDSGVAAEVGFASARNKPIIGLRTDERRATDGPRYPVNLQVTHLILNSGENTKIAQTVPEAIALIEAVIDAAP